MNLYPASNQIGKIAASYIVSFIQLVSVFVFTNPKKIFETRQVPANPGIKLFTLFSADLEFWCKYVKFFRYADDTTTSCSDKNLEEILSNLKHDAKQIINYMAINGLVANASKTVFMILNLTKKEAQKEITKDIEVGTTTVTRSESTKLLGIEIDDQQTGRTF